MNEEQQRSQSKRRRFYDEEFKRNAVELLERGERSAVQLSRELGISDCSLGKWKRKYGQHGRADQDFTVRKHIHRFVIRLNHSQ